MALAIALVLLVVGTVLFHFWSPWWFTPVASNWGSIDDTVNIAFWITGAVFVAVNLFMAYAVIRYRKRQGSRAHYEPESRKLEIWLTVITSIGVVGMLAPGLAVWGKFVTVPEDAAQVEVIGQQWNWSYRFPGTDGKFGTVDAKLVNLENPFGMNPDDANGRDDILIASQELHLPLNQPIKVLMRSKDVLHNFTVAQFRAKMDMVPGTVSYIWLTPTRSGTFDVLCEELCGVGHYAMRGKVVVEDAAAFQAWLSGYPSYADTMAATPGNASVGKAFYAVCAACHGPDGAGNAALHAPKLAGQHGWYLKRQLRHFKTGLRGAHEDDVFGKQMAPMAATLANDAAIDNVIAYIDTLPDVAAPNTVTGDVTKGKQLYATCGACHAPDGRGIWSQNAPRLAGMNDWYLNQQINNFIHGVRGAHPHDSYGAQMALVARMLRDEQDIQAVIAYIDTL